MLMEETIKLIKETLDKVRPFINRDGGDIEFVDFIDGIVYVNMKGACADCMMIDTTLSDGIEIILQEEFAPRALPRFAATMGSSDSC